MRYDGLVFCICLQFCVLLGTFSYDGSTLQIFTWYLIWEEFKLIGAWIVIDIVK